MALSIAVGGPEAAWPDVLMLDGVPGSCLGAMTGGACATFVGPASRWFFNRRNVGNLRSQTQAPGAPQHEFTCPKNGGHAAGCRMKSW